MKPIKNMLWMARIVVPILLLAVAFYYGYQFFNKYVREREILKQMLARLQADSRIAEVIVSRVEYNPLINKHMTTIKFLEYDTVGNPLEPKYFTFSSNIIQFQSLVVRFQDKFVLAGDAVRGRSVYLFWKVFVLAGSQTEEYVLTPADAVPEGYQISAGRSAFEEKIWKEFWSYALDSKKAVIEGIKNAQIEAPGTKFIPGLLYTLKIEHDGGIRIDVTPIPSVLKGERL